VKTYDLVTGLVLFFICVGICILAYGLGLGEIHDPGPGFLPFGISALLGLMALGLSLKSLIKISKAKQENAVFGKSRWGILILVLGALLFYGIFFKFLGFNICTFLLLILLLKIVGGQKWTVTISFSFITALCAYFIFVVWLNCQFPKGYFGI